MKNYVEEELAHGEIHYFYLFFLAAAAALGGLLFGFDIAIITGAGPFLIRHFHLNDLSLGWAFSSLLFGCVISSALAGRAADLWGRKPVLVAVSVLFAVTSIATGVATSFTMFVVARFLGGVAVGAISLISPMYVSEVAPPYLRGRLGALYQMSIVTGALVSYGINYLLRNAGPGNWRWMFMTGAIPSLLFLVLLILVPETPRYLFVVGRRAESFAILERIAGTRMAEFQIGEIETSLREKQGAWRDLWRPPMRRAVIVSFWLAVLVQFSGINTIIDYAPRIFESAGLRISAALLSTVAVGAVSFLSTIVSFAVIDRYGRRSTYIVGSLGMTCTLLGLVVAVERDHFHGAIVLVLVLAYLAFFSACIGPTFWTLVPEIFPNRIRGTAMTVPVLTQWVANAVVVLLFPEVFSQIGKATTFAFLAVMSLAQAFLVRFSLPETKCTPLEEIEAFWSGDQVPGQSIRTNLR